MKCRYLDEITGGRGIVFATGTPISNSMVELYTIQPVSYTHLGRIPMKLPMPQDGSSRFPVWKPIFVSA